MTQPSLDDDVAAAGGGAVGSDSGRYSTKAVLALILAIVSLAFLLVPVLSWAVSIPAVILGHLAVREIRSTRERGREVAAAGLVIGYLSIGLALVLLVGSAAAVAANTPPGSDHGACVTPTEPTDEQVQACIDSYGQ